MGRQSRGRRAFVLHTADHLHSAAIHLLRKLRRTDAKLEVRGPKLSALSVLVFGGPCTLTMLASAEHVRPPSMSRLVDELQREGLVARRTNPDDRRAIFIEATAEGRRVLEHGRKMRVTGLADRLETLPDSDLFMLKRAVEVLEQILTTQP